VTVTGLDLARLSGSRTVRGVTFGHATIRGIWHDWTIDVQKQVAGIQSTTVPCAEPPGGWKRAPRGTAAREGKPIFDLVERYRERMAHAVIALPHDPIDARLPGDVAEVFVITLPNAVVDSDRGGSDPASGCHSNSSREPDQERVKHHRSRSVQDQPRSHTSLDRPVGLEPTTRGLVGRTTSFAASPGSAGHTADPPTAASIIS
jgi:hypothetical protein